MSAEDVKEPKEGNPEPKSGEPNPKEQPKPSDRGSVSSNPTEELKSLQEKHDTLKRQYGASSEEAVRLSKKVDELEEQIKNLKVSRVSLPQNDEEFNALVANVGLAAAIKTVVQGEVKPIADKTEELYGKESKKILSDFKTKHPGLTGEILAKFDKEFDRLKVVYDDIHEAMEKAYTIVGGLDADKAAETDRKAGIAASQPDTEKQRVISNASGDPGNRQPSPVDPNAELTTKIEKLQGDALAKEASGRDATDLWTRVEQLKEQLAKKSV